MAEAGTLLIMAHTYYRTYYKIPVIVSPRWGFSIAQIL